MPSIMLSSPAVPSSASAVSSVVPSPATAISSAAPLSKVASASEVALLVAEVETLTEVLTITQNQLETLQHQNEIKESQIITKDSQKDDLIKQMKEEYEQMLSQIEKERIAERERYTRTITAIKRTTQPKNEEEKSVDEEEKNILKMKKDVDEMKKVIQKLSKENEELIMTLINVEKEYSIEVDGRRKDEHFLDLSSKTIFDLTKAFDFEKNKNKVLSDLLVEQGREIEVLLKSAREKTQRGVHVRRASGYWNGEVDLGESRSREGEEEVIPPPPLDEVDVDENGMY